jgi:hypothetical protein
MSQYAFRSRLAVLTVLGVGLVHVEPALCQQDPEVLAGVQNLRGHASGQQAGESAMFALALIKADTPKTDPVLTSCIANVQKCFTASGYTPQKGGGADIYEAAVVAMALSNLDSAEHRGEIGLVASFLIGRQRPSGCWDYPHRQAGDTSISQYALLGLWECENAGYDVAPAVWDRAASWYLSKKAPGGSWNYHRDETNHPETLSMTAAGVGSLLLCKRQLERVRQRKRASNPLLTPLGTEVPEASYEIKTSFREIDQAVREGSAWLAANYTTTSASGIGQSIYYGLYGIERIAALTDRQPFGKVDLMEKGRAYIRANQRPDGSWHYPPLNDDMNTVWAILFLTRSTAKRVRQVEIKKLGAGTLLGGRYLPKDLTTMTVAGGHLRSRPMNGAVEGMLAVLEDPRAQSADTAVSGLIERYQREGPEALRPYRDRFRKMLSDRDAGVRQVAAWALSRTADMDVAPDLIGALLDPAENVVLAARLGLQLLSRKIDSLGPPSPSTPAERQAAAARWRAWYDSIRPLEGDADQSEPRRTTARQTAAAPAAKPLGSPAP